MAIGEIPPAIDTVVAKIPPVVDVATCVVFGDVEIPLGLRSLADFRNWAISDAFPKRGRIDYLAGRIEVDMSPENLFCHNALKSEIHDVLRHRVRRERRGRVFSDRARFSCPAAHLSVEPDVSFVSRQALADHKLDPVPYANPEPDHFIEFEGPPDLAVEIISPSSVGKDTIRLPALYWAAGVREYWLADARKETMIFEIYSWGEKGFEPTVPDSDGFRISTVLECAYRLERFREDDGYWDFNLIERETVAGK